MSPDMLTITLGPDASAIIGDCRVTLKEMKRSYVKLLIETPFDVLVLRHEVAEKASRTRATGVGSQVAVITGGDLDSRGIGQTFNEQSPRRSIVLRRRKNEKVILGDCLIHVVAIQRVGARVGI